MAASVPANVGRSMLARGQAFISPLLTLPIRNTSTVSFLKQNGPSSLLRFQKDRSSPQFARSMSRRGCHAGLLCRASGGTSLQAPAKLEHESTEANNSEMRKSDDEFDTWAIKMLYDGDCPLCMREVNMLRERNKIYGTIKFVDITADDYSTEENAGIDFETAMGRIHAILRDGTILVDIAAFQRLYEEVGLGWVYAFTRYKPIASIADAVYSIWAKYRLPITGRPPLIEILEERRRKAEAGCNSEGKCRLD